MDGSKIRASLAMMNERGNGEGTGYAAYGIYPDFKDAYALHVFLDNVKENKPALVKEAESWVRSSTTNLYQPTNRDKKSPYPVAVFLYT